MKLKLYRGIAAKPDKAEMILQFIKKNGLLGDEGTWNFAVPDISDVRQRLDEIFRSENPSVDEIFEDTPFKGVCACGDEDSAKYYALIHNKSRGKTASILMSFEVDIDKVYVDCRDFLCSAFQFWDRKTIEMTKGQKSYLRELYGECIIPYFERCISSLDQNVRIAMCNIASFDKQVVKSHYQNRKTIGGRYRTRFCSAFFVQAPIVASHIKSCECIDDQFSIPEVDVDLGDFYYV